MWYAGSSRPALKGVTLDIYERRLLTVMGPSAAGKTTMLRTINRLNDRVPGTRVVGGVSLDGQDVYRQGVDVPRLRQRVGMVFALPTPLPMSVFDNVAYGPRQRGQVRGKALEETVEKALRAAALWDEVADRLSSPAADLSGGQQQRLSIARVLAVEPEVILLDEPTSGLDPLSTLRIEELLWELVKEYTIVLVTHNPQQAARLSADVAFLLDGELVERAPASRLFTRPQDKRTEDYVSGKFG